MLSFITVLRQVFRLAFTIPSSEMMKYIKLGECTDRVDYFSSHFKSCLTSHTVPTDTELFDAGVAYYHLVESLFRNYLTGAIALAPELFVRLLGSVQVISATRSCELSFIQLCDRMV